MRGWHRRPIFRHFFLPTLRIFHTAGARQSGLFGDWCATHRAHRASGFSGYRNHEQPVGAVTQAPGHRASWLQARPDPARPHGIARGGSQPFCRFRHYQPRQLCRVGNGIRHQPDCHTGHPQAPSVARAVGSAVIVRTERKDLTSLADLAGKRVVAVGPNAFGGFQLAWREFARGGGQQLHPLRRTKGNCMPQLSTKAVYIESVSYPPGNVTYIAHRHGVVCTQAPDHALTDLTQVLAAMRLLVTTAPSRATR